MNVIKRWQHRTATLSPKRRKLGLIAIVLTVVMSGIFLFSSKTTPVKKPDEKLAVEVVTPAKRNVDVENLNAQITAMQRQITDSQARAQQTETQLTERLAQISDQLSKSTANADVDRKIAEAVAKAKPTGSVELPKPSSSALPAPGTMPALNAPLPGALPAAGNPGVAPALAASRGISITGDEEEEVKDSAAASETLTDKTAKAGSKKTPEAWFPMGAILTGVALNGGDFPVTSASRRDPLPMLIRLKKDAILPNHARASVKECFVMVSGSGDMSTSRASLRAERISCVVDGNRSIELPISGYVVGEDGKPGLHGRLVTKEAEVIAKALRVGMIGAVGVGVTGLIGNELSAQSGNVNVSLGTGGSAGGSGGNGGAAPIGKSFEKITDYYSSLAKEIVPVVEINPLRSVDIVLTRGIGIPLK